MSKAKEIAETRPADKPEDTSGAWEPKIVAFLCNWCSYAGADLAGVADPQTGPGQGDRLIEAFAAGEDGVTPAQDGFSGPDEVVEAVDPVDVE